ncbi:SusC/RagA family TonB-linked outer membrane protein [Winogradskyella endarachnes]|uniref:SusC/RagA family TonB-linked outer membrane protein n=1 Tax=Winogradskyella endarachnes TaxID=2681965 RepID=A0A6L6UEC9_9FLAO|nr:TonB-dependent receptor [Winogradskyella endarachnes]MUU79134.1 SusC/RagA family TonB-linked outer membrane protein [Winogradskyella endarachnes]
MKIKLLKKLFFTLTILFGVFSQAQTVTGTVSSGDMPLPGASIIVKGTTNGTSSDFDGKYTIENVSTTSVLVVSYLGYITQEITVGNQSVINVTLIEDENSLEEVVVVGYGTKKKSLVTGAISSIDSKQIKSSSNQRVEQVLQGRTSGVTVTSSSGSPGQGAQIRIRGAGSSGSSEPLYIVDGMKSSSIATLAPSDIASMEVLKDAASAAIYGTEGANGVVIITTKGGSRGGIKVGFSTQLGTQFVNTDMELMNASQFVQYMNEAGISSVVDNGYNTNWIDSTFDKAPLTRYDLNVSGGNDKTSFYGSMGHLEQEGIVGQENSSFKRKTFRFNFKSELTKFLEVGVNATYSFSDRFGIQENSDTRGVIQNMLIIDPLTPVIYDSLADVPQSVLDNAAANNVPLLTDSNGNVYGYPSYSTGEVVNPVAYANVMNKTITNDVQSLYSAYLKLNILEGLSITTRFGKETGRIDVKNMINPYYVSSEASNTAYTGSHTKYENKRWLWENFITYNKSFKNHNFKLLAGYSAEDRDNVTLKATSGSVSIDEFTGFDFSLPGFNSNVTNPLPYLDNMVSTYGRLSYDYDGIYLFEASIRADKSDKFPEANRTAVFPAFSGGWLVSKEDFWKTESPISYLKLRASWGQNGSRSNLTGNADKTYIIEALNGLGIDYLGNTGAQITGYSNENLVWETSEQLNFGIDLRAFDNKLRFTTEYYKKTTRDAVVDDGSLITPGSAGFNSQAFNAGTIVNQGFEFELGYSDTTEGGFTYSINANLSTLKNEVTEILYVGDAGYLTGAGAPQNAEGITRFSEGLPAWYFYGYQTTGIDSNTGEILIADTNNDGDITDADKTMIGSPHPDVLYGGNISLGYKSFDFNLQFQGTIGNDIVATYHQPSRAITNKPIHFFNNRWQQPGDNASFPGAANVASAYDTDLVVEDGSYMRIKQIQLGYTLPRSFSDKLKLDNFRVYVSLDDFFTFTDYSGLDPEIGNFSFNAIGVDRGFYPTAAKAIFGLALDF